jgi:hypothetical protein
MASPNIHPIAPGSLARTSIVVSAANANRDGTTGTYTNVVATAGSNGGVVPEVRAYSAAAVGASTAMVLRLWHRVAGTGNYFLIDEVAMATVTSSTTAIGATAVFNRTNIPLGPSDTLNVTQTVAEAVHYSAACGNY